MAINVKSILILPGLDGTGDLLNDFAANLSADFEVTVLTYGPDQTDYQALFAYVKAHAPHQDFIVLGESFSGPLAGLCAHAALPNLKAVVFAATFLTRPSIWPAWVVNLLWVIPFRNRLMLKILRPMFMGFKPDQAVFEIFLQAMQKVPKSAFLARLKAVHQLPFEIDTPPHIPSLFLRAKREWFLSKKCGDQLANIVDQTIEIDAPHFLLQCQPKLAADKVRDFIHGL